MAEVKLLTPEEIASMRPWLDERDHERIANWWHVHFDPEQVVATLEALQAEIVYLRRQIALENQDPEFGGWKCDPDKPRHLCPPPE